MVSAPFDDLAAWVAELDARVRDVVELADVPEPVVVEVCVEGDDGSAATFHLVAGPGPARVHPGPAAGADLTLIASAAAAAALLAGDTNAQGCLADGSLRMRGNPDVLLRRLPGLVRVGSEA